MSYISKRGRRPIETASKSAHLYVIKDTEVQKFLQKCELPKNTEEIDGSSLEPMVLPNINHNPISRIVAIDGSYREISVKNEFPSSMLAFIQIGASFFNTSDLDSLSEIPFIDEEDMEKLRQIERIKLVIPTKGMSLKDESSLNKSVRKAIFDFFKTKPDKENLFIDTLNWFVFKDYKNKNGSNDEYQLASCPNLDCDEKRINLNRKQKVGGHTFRCPSCNGDIYLTDVFRFHEVIDEELGASGILGYLLTLVEQMFLIHIIRLMLKTKPSLLEETLFIKDGPLAFFGQTANMHKLMRELCNYLNKEKKIFLIGLEKTGSFVEHADQIKSKLESGEILLLDNNYIYKYIIPGKADPGNPYASTSYYSGKIIFKDRNNRMYVSTLPTESSDVILNPSKEDYKNLDIILNNIEKLKCDMYDDGLLPVALVNKLISLADHPSAVILERFAKSGVDN